MKAITDSKASEAQASSHMTQSGTNTFEENPEILDESHASALKLDSLDFLVEFPTISALDLDVLKLTAQFAAKNGKQFFLHLSQKESRNPQFDFLKPHHGLHTLYQLLIKQYSLVLEPSKALLERVKRCAFNKTDHLKLVKQRSQIERLERQRIHEEEAAHNAEMEAFSKIDWHDFSIAETVTFGPEDQHKDFPVPLNLQILKAMPIVQRLEMWTGRRAELETSVKAPEDQDEEMEMEIDEPNEFAAPLIASGKAASSNEIIFGAAFGSGAPIKVRTDYVPRATATSGPTQVCTICKAPVPVSEIEEHIRIELLDPKWRTQRLAAMEKNRESNLVETGTDVSRNLEALARHRSDIFSASSGNGGNQTIERGPTRPIWDGNVDSVGQINRAAQIFAKPQIEKEMEALQRSGDYSLDPSKGIGPRAPQAYNQGYRPAQPQAPPQYPAMFLPPPPGTMMSFPPGMPNMPLSYPPNMPMPPNMLPYPPNMQFPPNMPFPPGMALPPNMPFPPYTNPNQPQSPPKPEDQKK